MLNRLILKVTKFQLPPPKRLGTVVKNILGDIMPPCQIGLRPSGKLSMKIIACLTSFPDSKIDDTAKGGLTIFWELSTVIPNI